MDEVVVSCRPELAELERLRDLFLQYAGEHGFDSEAVSAVRLALEEIAVNILHHGFDSAPEPFEVRWALEGDTLRIEIEDAGRAFNPLERELPDVGMELESRKIGGLGIFLVRQLMDRLDYRREHGHNVFIMQKRVRTWK